MNKQEQLKLAFHLACDMKHFEITKIMIENGLSVNDGLFIACKSGCLKMVQLLLEKGADPTANDTIKWACTNGHTEVVALLLRDGRVEVDDLTIRNAATDEINDMLIAYKYRVDGQEYCKMKENI
jgi:ankyrin repeat protein